MSAMVVWRVGVCVRVRVRVRVRARGGVAWRVILGWTEITSDASSWQWQRARGS